MYSDTLPKTKSSELTRHPERPTCINSGCKSKVTNDGSRYRPVCSNCYNAGRGATRYYEGVTPYRTGECSNKDEHLGFPCPVDWKVMKEHFSEFILTHLDHKDSNHWNNVPRNVEELCPLCHDKKGKINGDKAGHRYHK